MQTPQLFKGNYSIAVFALLGEHHLATVSQIPLFNLNEGHF